MLIYWRVNHLMLIHIVKITALKSQDPITCRLVDPRSSGGYDGTTSWILREWDALWPEIAQLFFASQFFSQKIVS